MTTMPRAGKTLLNKVKLGFYRQHTSLNKWCKEHGYTRPYAYQCLIGRCLGGKTEMIIRNTLWQASQQETNHDQK